MVTEFFMAMFPPTATHQEKQVHVVNGRPVFYELQELKTARMKFRDSLGRFAPEHPYPGAVRLITKWCYPAGDRHRNGEYKTTRPDTDNMIKLLKDEMTKARFWKDDAQVASEVTEKFFSDVPGIYVRIEEV